MSSNFCELCEQAYDLSTRRPRRLQCSCVYCEKCLKIYSKVKQYFKCQVHKLKDYSKIEELEIPSLLLSEDQAIQQNQLKQQCQQHQNVFEFFCIDDETQICGTCTITTHKGHQIQPIEQKIKQMQTQINQELSEAQQ